MIADAVGAKCRVLVGTNALNAAAFSDFSGGLAVNLPPEQAALRDWVLAAVQPAAAV